MKYIPSTLPNARQYDFWNNPFRADFVMKPLKNIMKRASVVNLEHTDIFINVGNKTMDSNRTIRRRNQSNNCIPFDILFDDLRILYQNLISLNLAGNILLSLPPLTIREDIGVSEISLNLQENKLHRVSDFTLMTGNAAFFWVGGEYTPIIKLDFAKNSIKKYKSFMFVLYSIIVLKHLQSSPTRH